MTVIQNKRILKYLLLMVVSLLLVLDLSIGVSASANYDRQEADACITISQRLSGKGGSGSVEYGELDSLGRTTGVEAVITPDMIGTGSPAKSSIKPAGFGGQAQGHARGHLLGNQLGGSGSDPRNLMTI